MIKTTKENKIFFETLMAITLTIMGIIVSVISLIISYSIGKRTISIQEMQLDIARQSQLPHFYVISTAQANEISDPLLFEMYIDYKIVNSGGDINDASLIAKSQIEVIFLNYEINKRICLTIDNLDRFSNWYSLYDSESKSFTIRENYESLFNLESSLKKGLSNYYKEYEVYVFIYDYINIQYKDAFGETHDDWYRMHVSDLENVSPITNASLSLKSKTMTDEEICDFIINSLNHIINTECN